MTQSKRDHTVELDVLRFAAAVAVMLYHYVAWYTIDLPQGSVTLQHTSVFTRFGWLGVPLFFMISGYVILNSALSRTTRQFAVARFIRLYPLYWVCMAGTIAILFLTSRISNAHRAIPTYGISTTLANLTMVHTALGFESIDGVYWTLLKELQFYVLMGLLIAAGVVKHVRWWLTIWLLVTLAVYVTGHPSFVGVVISPEYSPFFIAGIAFSLMRSNGTNKFNTGVAIAALALACWSMVKTAPTFMPVSGGSSVSICQVVIAVFFAAFFMVASRRTGMNASPAISTLGMMTYPLYLLHNFAGKAIMNSFLPILRPKYLVVAMSCLAIGAAYVVFRYVDRPMANWLRDLTRAASGTSRATPAPSTPVGTDSSSSTISQKR